MKELLIKVDPFSLSLSNSLFSISGHISDIKREDFLPASKADFPCKSNLSIHIFTCKIYQYTQMSLTPLPVRYVNAYRYYSQQTVQTIIHSLYEKKRGSSDNTKEYCKVHMKIPPIYLI